MERNFSLKLIEKELQQKGKDVANFQYILEKMLTEGTIGKLSEVIREIAENEKNFAVSQLSKFLGQSEEDYNRNLKRNIDVFKSCFKLITKELINTIFKQTLINSTRCQVNTLNIISEQDEEETPQTDRDFNNQNENHQIDLFEQTIGSQRSIVSQMNKFTTGNKKSLKEETFDHSQFRSRYLSSDNKDRLGINFSSIKDFDTQPDHLFKSHLPVTKKLKNKSNFKEKLQIISKSLRKELGLKNAKVNQREKLRQKVNKLRHKNTSLVLVQRSLESKFNLSSKREKISQNQEKKIKIISIDLSDKENKNGKNFN